MLVVIEKATGIVKGQGKQTQWIAVTVGITAAFRLNAWFPARIVFRHEDRKRLATRPTPIAFVTGLVSHR